MFRKSKSPSFGFGSVSAAASKAKILLENTEMPGAEELPESCDRWQKSML